MRKTILILTALVMIFSLAACGAKNDAGMPNPMREVASLEKLSDEGNCALIRPEGVELTDEAYYIINGEPKTAEYLFKVDGVECFLRFAEADAATDISGIYNGDGTLFADCDDSTTYIENDSLKAKRWFTVDGQYVFAAMDEGAMDWYTYDGICTQFEDMEPKNWNAEVPFATYKALEGSYYNDDMSVAGAIRITGDHAGLYVIADQEDGSRIYREMEAVLIGDDLVYEKETVSRIVFDEAAGGTVMTQLEDGGAGSVRVKDGTLDFSKAWSEDLKGIVLTLSR